MPILKSFLKDGEAESYQNVVVTFVPGRKAVMTIYESDDGDEAGGGEESWVEKEQIVRSDYKTKVCMHVAVCILGCVSSNMCFIIVNPCALPHSLVMK